MQLLLYWYYFLYNVEFKMYLFIFLKGLFKYKGYFGHFSY